MRTVLTALAARRHPVLRWEDASGATLELTGPVLANWVHKAHGLFADIDLGPDLALGIVAESPARPGDPVPPLHWRALAGALAAWSLGARVRMIDAEAPEDPWAALVPEPRAEDPVLHSADEVLVFPLAPLALSVDTPPDTVDFAAALRSYPDEAPVPAVPAVAFGDAATLETVPLADLTAPQAAGTAAEAVVTAVPVRAEDWARGLTGLLHGVLVLRP